MSVLRIEKLIEFLKKHFESGIQMFDTPSIMPDFRAPIYDKDDILVLFAPVMSKSIRDLTIHEVENIDIDGRYFSTEELAEAKLKELRGGENG